MIIDLHRAPSPRPSIESLPGYVAVVQSQPPRYTPAQRPLQPVTYTFTNWSSDSMLLMPPVTLANPGPLYHISVSLNLNPFVPLSWVTRIHRGGSSAGEEVGEFEMSLSQRSGSIMISDFTARLANVLFSIQNSARHWHWSCGSVKLRWDCRMTLDDGSPMCICFSTDASVAQLASFVPPPIDASPPLPAASLTVFPDGHDVLDHILISALIIERKRTLSF